MIYVIIILIILIILLANKTHKNLEKADFRDDLYIPENPESYVSPSNSSRLNRIVGITPNIELDKFNIIREFSFKKVLPNQGQKKCYRVKCKPWYQKIRCMKCE